MVLRKTELELMYSMEIWLQLNAYVLACLCFKCNSRGLIKLAENYALFFVF